MHATHERRELNFNSGLHRQRAFQNNAGGKLHRCYKLSSVSEFVVA